MARISVRFWGILVVCLCWAAMAEAEYKKYKDPKQPINVRIKDLMSRMTLEEKIGQMTQIDRTVASGQVINKYLLGKHISSSFFPSFFPFIHTRSNRGAWLDSNWNWIRSIDILTINGYCGFELIVGRECVEWRRECSGRECISRDLDRHGKWLSSRCANHPPWDPNYLRHRCSPRPQ